MQDQWRSKIFRPACQENGSLVRFICFAEFQTLPPFEQLTGTVVQFEGAVNLSILVEKRESTTELLDEKLRTMESHHAKVSKLKNLSRQASGPGFERERETERERDRD